jgi:hypothetical protein
MLSCFNLFAGIDLAEDEILFNKSMSAVRICVEWGFEKVVSNFAFVDFKKSQKVLLQPIGRMYTVAVLLANCHTCLYGSQTGAFFNLHPPSLYEYFDI